MKAPYPNGLFGLDTPLEKARIAVIPVPWDVTTSYGKGTSLGPEAILHASMQVDLFDRELGAIHELGYALMPFPHDLKALNDQLDKAVPKVNQACDKMCSHVYEQAKLALQRNQIPAVLGGDHSTPEGNIRAISEWVNGDFGILHVDAHADLREAYQGFTHSHASIMFNVMNSAWRPKKLVQVAIRDFCEEENTLIEKRPDIQTFFDADLKARLFNGETWHSLCEEVVKALPPSVYISFDIDGLSPEFCPSTGTPVPGGLSFDQAVYLLRRVVKNGRRIVGFDLSEVAPGPSEWDANVGARLLFKMCGWTLLSQTIHHRA